MKDSVRHTGTGLTSRVVTNFRVPGHADHRKGHLRAVNTELVRVLGAALSSPSQHVSCAVLTLLEIRLQSLKQLARMDEDELKEAISGDPELKELLMEEMSRKLRRAVGRSSVLIGLMSSGGLDSLFEMFDPDSPFGPHR